MKNFADISMLMALDLTCIKEIAILQADGKLRVIVPMRHLYIP